MAIRIRKTGEMLCAAHANPEEGDTYLHDGIHYYMSVMTGSIIASANHDIDNLWFWNIPEHLMSHHLEIQNQTTQK